MERVENREICSKCGGKCCKKSGCDYSTKDFDDLSVNAIYQKLEEGNISIVAFLNFNRLPNGRLACSPFLYLRARNTDRGVVDLLSFKKRNNQSKRRASSFTLVILMRSALPLAIIILPLPILLNFVVDPRLYLSQ